MRRGGGCGCLLDARLDGRTLLGALVARIIESGKRIGRLFVVAMMVIGEKRVRKEKVK